MPKISQIKVLESQRQPKFSTKTAFQEKDNRNRLPHYKAHPAGLCGTGTFLSTPKGFFFFSKKGWQKLQADTTAKFGKTLSHMLCKLPNGNFLISSF